jgi:hypothetical protein
MTSSVIRVGGESDFLDINITIAATIKSPRNITPVVNETMSTQTGHEGEV